MSKKYRIYCVTESINKFIVADSAPTVCPMSAEHVINNDSIGLLEDYSIGVGVFGDGSDGDVIISADTTITRDMYYRNLTFTGAYNLLTISCRIFVTDTLNLANGTLSCNGGIGVPSSAVGTGGGAASSTAKSLGFGTAGGAGGFSSTAGLPGGPHTPNTRLGGLGGAGGASGARSGGLGGTGTVNPDTSGGLGIFKCGEFAINGRNVLNAQMNGGTAGGGGGGPNGGGGGGGGGCIVVCARNIVATTGGIYANGGNGSTPSASGGGGGGGGGGGYIVVITTSNISTLLLGVNGGLGGVSPSATSGQPGANGNVYKIII
jgi:hypothetical protein